MRSESRSDNGAVALGLALVGLLLLAGMGVGGLYLFSARSQAEIAQAQAEAERASVIAYAKELEAKSGAAASARAPYPITQAVALTPAPPFQEPAADEHVHESHAATQHGENAADEHAHAEAHAAAAPADANDAAVRAAVEQVIRIQEDAWNRGDVDSFVAHYWNSDDVTFSSGGQITRGWTATRDRYRERYPTKEAMGRTTFSNLEITPLGDSAAMVLGNWKLEREADPIGGNFTLVMRKIDGRWVIIHDHTSKLAE
jgi:ketosteroid isomerase-like protein